MSRFISPTLVTLAGLGALVAVEGPTPPPAAADHESGLRWGAYGELHYNNFSGDSKTDEVDFHRFVFLAEYSFDDRTHLVAEIEIEHALAGEGKPGEVELEQAYIGFDLNEQHQLRAGVMLVPASRLNIHHEPAMFHGVERPYVEKVIIPTTWWEAGVGLDGSLTEDLDYQVMLTSTLNSDKFSSSGIRSGRGKVAQAKAGGFQLAGRLDWTPRADLALGTSLVVGETGQDSDDPSAVMTIFSADGIYTWNQVEVSGTFAHGSIGDADELAVGTPEAFVGGYLTVAYDLFHHWQEAGEQTLQAFARYEFFDTQASVPDGVSEDESKTGSIIQVGLTWKVRPNIAVKVDFQDWDNDADSAIDQWNAGIGFHF